MSTVTNMPGRSRPSGLGTSISPVVLKLPSTRNGEMRDSRAHSGRLKLTGTRRKLTSFGSLAAQGVIRGWKSLQWLQP